MGVGGFEASSLEKSPPALGGTFSDDLRFSPTIKVGFSVSGVASPIVSEVWGLESCDELRCVFRRRRCWMELRGLSDDE